MNKSQMLAELKKNLKSAQLPTYIDMELEVDTLTMTIYDPVGNMQTDSAAFEAWALVLKAYIPSIKKVVLDVDQIITIGPKERLHYNRFLWRASNFESIFDWFHIGNFSGEVGALKKRLDTANKIMINQPRGSRTKPQNSTGEVYVEWLFANMHAKELCNAVGCDFLTNQFPVGIFENTVSQATRIFNGSKSAIDLVGLENPDTLHLIELKTGSNRKMGIFSEFLFYAFVMHNLFQLKQFSFERALKQDDFLPFNTLTASEIKGHLLAELYHPLISKEVLALVNQGLNPLNISLDLYQYVRTDQDIIGNIEKVLL